MSEGYIYIRTHPAYNIYNVCKLGKTNNIVDRNNQYITGEFIKGIFIIIFKVKYVNAIEKLLQNEFNEYNIRNNGGTEFYCNKIIELIEPIFNKYNIQYYKLSNDDINKLTRTKRIKEIVKKIDIKLLINILKNHNIYKPRDYQLDIINKSVSYFENRNKGVLVLTCGIGKTLISLWIAQKLGATKIVIGVPTVILLEQWRTYINYLFKNIPILIINGQIKKKNINEIVKNDNFIIITTYISSNKISKDIIYDIIILDECHHITSIETDIFQDKKRNINILGLQSKKQLSLTATLKCIMSNNQTISNDNIIYFGDIIESRSLLWGIENNIVCDYIIQTIYTDDYLEYIDNKDRKLFLASYAALKSIVDNCSHHLLIYANNCENAEKIINYIKILLNNNFFTISNLYYSRYFSEMTKNEQLNIIENFKKSKCGIISCVLCLGEGYDCPIIDGVVFAENMISKVRIVQSALRSCRKNKNEPNKINKIIIPILNKNIDDLDNYDYKNIKEIIYQLGEEDELIIHKIKAYKINIIKNKEMSYTIFNDYDPVLTENIKLKSINRHELTYQKIKNIINKYNIKTKKEYYNICDKDYRLPKEPDIMFKQFTNWIDYLGIKRIYYNFNDCKKKINEYLINNSLSRTHHLSTIVDNLCKIDNNFPPNDLWLDYYNINDLNKIITIDRKIKKLI